MSFVDLGARPLAPGELRRFTQRLGALAVLDETSRAFRAQGLRHLRMDDAEIEERLLADARLLRLPLVRMGTRLSAGVVPSAWKEWLSAGPAP